MQIFKNLEEHIEHIALVLLVTALSMIAYFLTSPQPPRERTKSAFAGGVIAGVLSYPTWDLIGSMTPSLSTSQYNKYRNIFSIIDLRKYN